MSPIPDFNKRRYKTFDGKVGIKNTIPLEGGFDYEATLPIH